MRITPEQARQQLAEGNQRFAGGGARRPHSNLSRMVELAREEPAPVAVVVGCIDSRVPPEIIFDQGLGDLMVVRLAGIPGATELVGSVELAVQAFGIPLVVVLGHTHCAALAAAAAGQAQDGNLLDLQEWLTPAVDHVRTRQPSLPPAQFAREVELENTRLAVEALLHGSPLLRQAVREGRLQIWGAMYSLESCLVEWLGRHAQEAEILDRDLEVLDREVLAGDSKVGP